jgi:hypothetical protein
VPKYKVHRGSFSLKINGVKPPTIYHRGEVFESPRTDLEAKNNRPGAPIRIEKVSDATPLTAVKPGIRSRKERKEQETEAPKAAPQMPANEVADTYDAMTVEQLRSHAAAEEIPLGAAKTKAEIIAALRSANV